MIKEKISVVRLIGDIKQDQQVLPFLAEKSREGVPLILVHGGRAAINKEIAARGLPQPFFIGGKRFTNRQSLDVVVSVLDSIGRDYAAKLNALGVDAFSVSSNSGIFTSPKDPDLGFVGEAAWFRGAYELDAEFNKGRVPIVTPVGYEHGNSLKQKLNLSSDEVAATLAVEHQSDYPELKLIMLGDQPGIMHDGQLQKSISEAQYLEMMKSGKLNSDIKARLITALYARDDGVKRILICNADNLATAFSSHFTGTEVVE